MENLEALVNLEELWLGKNKITKIEVTLSFIANYRKRSNWTKNLQTLKKLKILSLQSNRITVLENLEELHNLEQLYLSHNGVKKLEGLEHNVGLGTVFFCSPLTDFLYEDKTHNT